MNEHVTRLVNEVAETKGQVASMAAFVRGVPTLVRAAVQEALEANPGLNPEDLAAITTAADELDAAQSEILAAMESAQPAPTTPAEAPTGSNFGLGEATLVETAPGAVDGEDFASSADRNVTGDGRL